MTSNLQVVEDGLIVSKLRKHFIHKRESQYSVGFVSDILGTPYGEIELAGTLGKFLLDNEVSLASNKLTFSVKIGPLTYYKALVATCNPKNSYSLAYPPYETL